MLIVLRGLRVLTVVAAMTSGAAVFGLKRTDDASLKCASINSGDSDYNVLVVGESWASDGKILPDLPEAISHRLGGRGVRACSVGFSGRTTKLMYYELREKFPLERLNALFEGKEPDKLIFLTGVNDVVQHIGASSYVEYTKKLVEYFPRIADVEIVSIPRVNEVKFEPANLFSGLKRFVLMCAHDRCSIEANDKYRIALWRDHPELRTIEFDDFIEKFEGNEKCYTADGVHLTAECFHRYGAFIGNSAFLDDKIARRP
jgi:hypothetical protein